ncbi:hypothetical protein AB0L13_29850 [Saccharopolyspora shandongensis]|uniref:hypothetical protein n=1 Tax=Saccharopolyspora shandongensis TaxID=418495 RepID=UPI0034182161
MRTGKDTDRGVAEPADPICVVIRQAEEPEEGVHGQGSTVSLQQVRLALGLETVDELVCPGRDPLFE